MTLQLAPGHRVVEETRTGYWIEVGLPHEPYRAFLPKPLPPEPPLALTPADLDLLERANRALGRLDGMADVFPDIEVFLSVWLLKEAVFSSQIEGTQSSLSDLLMFEVEGRAEAVDDLRETANYVAAVNAGIEGLRSLPLSMRLLRDAHEHLLRSGRGSERNPGVVRTTQNWIGGTRPGTATYVPPPPEYVPDLLSELERFLNDVPSRTSLLAKAALAHAQFETIHPFLDGNGRVGRLLIVVLFQAEGALSRPLLYISWFFQRHREIYYDLLQRTRTTGDWESWVRFFFEAVEKTAEEAVRSARRALKIFAEDEARIRQGARSNAGSLLIVLSVLKVSPIVSVSFLTKKTNLSKPTVNNAVRSLVELGIVRELTGNRRNRWFGYDRYLDVLHDDNDSA